MLTKAINNREARMKYVGIFDDEEEEKSYYQLKAEAETELKRGFQVLKHLFNDLQKRDRFREQSRYEFYNNVLGHIEDQLSSNDWDLYKVFDLANSPYDSASRPGGNFDVWEVEPPARRLADGFVKRRNISSLNKHLRKFEELKKRDYEPSNG